LYIDKQQEDMTMQIAVQCRGFVLTDAIDDHVRKRFGFTLGRGAVQIRRVDVTLSDLNGPRGGVDKRCCVQVRLDGLQPVVVSDVQSDLYGAIDRAAARAGRTVMRRLELNSDRRRMAAVHELHRGLAGP
jgi:ribosome-associated translation inhibitor RaiA